MAKIFVSVPVLGRPNLRMIESLYSAAKTCKDHEVKIYFSENDSMISRVRNVHLSVFINDYKNYDYFISIDSDIEILNKYESNNIFNKLISHDKDFVGGLYSLKSPGSPICSSIPMDRNRNPNFNSGLKKMLWLSSGCWCLKRSMIEKMIEKYKFLIYDGDDNMLGKKIYGLYIPFVKEVRDNNKVIKKYLSEDWAFSSRWKDVGGEIYADTSIVLNHYGETAFPLWRVEMVINKETIKEDKLGLPKPGFDLI